jgi:hypothetical protein
MSQEKPEDEELVFGEKLLGLQSFSATRAKRYREELEKLLVHRLSTFERWWTGAYAGFVAVAFVGGGVSLACSKEHPEFQELDQARLTFAATMASMGLIMGGWLLRIAIQGGYGRRLGDFMGLFIALLFCVGFAYALVDMAWAVSDSLMRIKLLLGGGTLIAFLVTCAVIAHFQRLHRQTQEKLLRIEYHLAELMERTTDSSSR